MGAADSVPGVSGGTMALIVGIYERLLACIGTGFRAILLLLKLDIKGSLERLRAVEWAFLLPLVVGIGSAILVAARFIPGLLESYPAHMRGLFLGMVAASLAIPWKRIEQPNRTHVLVAAAAAVLAFFFSALPGSAAGGDPSLLRVFLTASVAICAMILPGVSGAFLLEVLGLYEPTLAAINARDLAYVAVFALGAVAGLGSFSLLLTRLLRTHHDVTMAALVGLMVGSLRALWPWQDEARTLEGPPALETGLAVAAVALVGFLIVLGIEKIGEARSRHS